MLTSPESTGGGGGEALNTLIHSVCVCVCVCMCVCDRDRGTERRDRTTKRERETEKEKRDVCVDFHILIQEKRCFEF